MNQDVPGRGGARVWQQCALGTFTDRFSATVPAHGAMLVKVGRGGAKW